MEEKYSGSKYIESWLHKKDGKKYEEFWVVLKSSYMFLFKDQNTHVKEQFVGFVQIEENTEAKAESGSKEGKCGFRIQTGKEKHFFRAYHDILRKRWLFAIDLSKKRRAPGPLPGDLDFTGDKAGDYDPLEDHIPAKTRAFSEVTPPQLLTFTGYRSKSLDHSSTGRPIVQVPIRTSLEDSDEEVADEGYVNVDNENDYDGVFLPSRLTNLPWYYGDISREKAIEMLSKERVGTYLLRDSGSCPVGEAYTVTVKDAAKIKNHKIISSDAKFIFEGAEHLKFDSPSEAVIYLMRHTYNKQDPVPLRKQESNDLRLPGDGVETSTYYNMEKERPLAKSFTARPKVPTRSRTVSDTPTYPERVATLPSVPTRTMGARPLPAIPSNQELTTMEHENRGEDAYMNSLTIRLQNAVLRGRPGGEAAPLPPETLTSHSSYKQRRHSDIPSSAWYENCPDNIMRPANFSRDNRMTGKYDSYNNNLQR